MNVFNEMEFTEICRQFNTGSFIEDETVRYANKSYFNKLKSSVARDRRGEVVFCVIRQNGKIITVTGKDYPEGIFRIPTGGIGHKENILEAAYREVKEELGLNVRISQFAGVIRIMFKHCEESFMFYSYIFIMHETGGRLLLDADDDEVTGVREVNLVELEQSVESLNCIQGKWSDWGKFRFITSNAVHKYLSKKDSMSD